MKYFPNKEKEIGKLNFSQLFFIANSLSSFLHTTQSTVIKLYHGHTHFCYTIHLCIYVESHMHVGTKVPQCTPAGQRTMLWSHFSHWTQILVVSTKSPHCPTSCLSKDNKLLSQDGGEHFSPCRDDLMPLCQTSASIHKTVGVIQGKHTRKSKEAWKGQPALHRSWWNGDRHRLRSNELQSTSLNKQAESSY